MKKLKLLLDAKKLKFLLKNENVKKSFNKSLSKLIPVTKTVDPKRLKFPLKIVKAEKELKFINNTKIIYTKKDNLSFLGANSSLQKLTDSNTIFSKWILLGNYKKTLTFTLSAKNVTNLF